MIQSFKQIARKYTGKKILLAISGGIDSVVLASLCRQANLDMEWAHCNFKLRGQESDADEAFVRQLAQEYQVKCHIKQCDMQVAKNIQIAARDARYQWFMQLKEKYGFDYIFTAHQLNDAIETFFINLQRTTGIKGLLGITETVIYKRPLLHFTRNQIEEYARNQNLTWREDSSNASDKYQRNYIRKHIVPEFKKLNPAFENNIKKTLHFLKQDYQIIADWFQEKQQQWTVQKGEDLWIDLQKIHHAESFLFRLLSTFDFTDWQAVKKLLSAQSGKKVYSTSHQLTKHQDFLIISPLKNIKQEFYHIQTPHDNIQIPFSLYLEMLDKEEIDWKKIKTAKPNEIYVDSDKIKFPITIRKWEAGDYFYPIGMQGKKKVSDFLINHKISLPEKEEIWLLCSQEKIIWIAGFRADNRFKITDKTKHILHLKIN